MAFIEGAARVAETASAPGTSAFTLAGAVTDYRAFSTVMANLDTCPYAAVCAGVGWEKGLGTWNTGGTLSRTTILESSNAGAAVNFSGTTTIFLGYPGLDQLLAYMPLNTGRATVASAATTAPIWAATGNQIDYTGTTTATGFPAAPRAGAERTLVCAAACAFTAGANMLIAGVTSGSTVTMAANDVVKVRAITTTQFHLSIERYSGQPVVGYYVGTSAPSNPYIGQQWWESTNGKGFVYYSNNGSPVWVEEVDAPYFPLVFDGGSATTFNATHQIDCGAAS